MRQTNINKEFRVYQLHINDTWVSRNRTGCRLENLAESLSLRLRHYTFPYV
uniref:hypothetical protein n=1 Tax=Prevotella denticola TaxID=28129 RepID=UPI0028803D0E|nr:hypothetical protein [Prevotella denticola]